MLTGALIKAVSNEEGSFLTLFISNPPKAFCHPPFNHLQAATLDEISKVPIARAYYERFFKDNL